MSKAVPRIHTQTNTHTDTHTHTHRRGLLAAKQFEMTSPFIWYGPVVNGAANCFYRRTREDWNSVRERERKRKEIHKIKWDKDRNEGMEETRHKKGVSKGRWGRWQISQRKRRRNELFKFEGKKRKETDVEKGECLISQRELNTETKITVKIIMRTERELLVPLGQIMTQVHKATTMSHKYECGRRTTTQSAEIWGTPCLSLDRPSKNTQTHSQFNLHLFIWKRLSHLHLSVLQMLLQLHPLIWQKLLPLNLHLFM